MRNHFKNLLLKDPMINIDEQLVGGSFKELMRGCCVVCATHWVRGFRQWSSECDAELPEVKSGALFSQSLPKVPVWQTHLHSVPDRMGLALLGHGAHLHVSNSSMYCSRALRRWRLLVTAHGIPRTRSMIGKA